MFISQADPGFNNEPGDLSITSGIIVVLLLNVFLLISRLGKRFVLASITAERAMGVAVTKNCGNNGTQRNS